MSDYAVINPATGEHVKDYPTITDAELANAVALAQKTHDEWSRKTTVKERAEMVRKLLVEGPVERWDGVTEALLHFAARREHLRTTVLPAIAGGTWVVSDRFADSTMAYQGYGHGADRAMLGTLYDIAVGEFRPDLTLILDLPVETGLARAAARRGTETRYESLPVAFHERVRAGFLDIAAADPGRCVVIDASADKSKAEAAIVAAVRDRLGVAVK